MIRPSARDSSTLFRRLGQLLGEGRGVQCRAHHLGRARRRRACGARITAAACFSMIASIRDVGVEGAGHLVEVEQRLGQHGQLGTGPQPARRRGHGELGQAAAGGQFADGGAAVAQQELARPGRAAGRRRSPRGGRRGVPARRPRPRNPSIEMASSRRSSWSWASGDSRATMPRSTGPAGGPRSAGRSRGAGRRGRSRAPAPAGGRRRSAGRRGPRSPARSGRAGRGSRCCARRRSPWSAPARWCSRRPAAGRRSRSKSARISPEHLQVARPPGGSPARRAASRGTARPWRRGRAATPRSEWRVDEFGQLGDHLQVLQRPAADARALHLDRDRPAVAQRRPVHLAEGGRADRAAARSCRTPWRCRTPSSSSTTCSATPGSSGSTSSRSRDSASQVDRREQIGPGGQQLAELDEGRAHPDELVDELRASSSVAVPPSSA